MPHAHTLAVHSMTRRNAIAQRFPEMLTLYVSPDPTITITITITNDHHLCHASVAVNVPMLVRH